MVRNKKRIKEIVKCLENIGVRVAWNNGYAYYAFYGDCIFIDFVDQESRFCVTIREYDNRQFSEDDYDEIDDSFGERDYMDYDDENIHPVFNTGSAYLFAHEIQKYLKDWKAINDPLYLACKEAVKEEEKQFAKPGFFCIIRKKLLEEA